MDDQHLDMGGVDVGFGIVRESKLLVSVFVVLVTAVLIADTSYSTSIFELSPVDFVIESDGHDWITWSDEMKAMYVAGALSTIAFVAPSDTIYVIGSRSREIWATAIIAYVAGIDAYYEKHPLGTPLVVVLGAASGGLLGEVYDLMKASNARSPIPQNETEHLTFSPSLYVEVVDWIWSQSDGRIRWSGEVRNQSGQTCESLRVSVSFYDASGRLVGTDFDIVFDVLDGQTVRISGTSYDVIGTAASGVARVEACR